jgi:plastocyanin
LLAGVLAVAATATWFATRSDAATSSVAIRDFAFQPADLTVQVGDTVTWTNGDSEPHAVQGGPMSSPDIAPGGSFSHTFTSPGDVDYQCRIHTYMTGVVRVMDHAPPSTTTSTTSAPATTTTTAPSTTTTSAAPGSTSSTTSTTAAPGSSTTTTTAAPPPSSGPGFQDVPDDPAATSPPGTPGATTPPPTAAPATTTTTTTTTTTAPPSSPPPAQDVPDDPDDGHPPGPSPASSTDLGDATVLAPSTDEGGVKVFHLTMAPTTIETAPGVVKPAYAFNGTVPGPVLRVDEGDRVRIVVDNQLPVATAVHWHGMVLPIEQDGVPGITQPFIEPGDRYVYEWTAVATGTHWYHSHSSGRHIGKGLYGALEVVPKAGDFRADRDYRLMLGDSDLGFVLNGRMFPSTTTLRTKVGETVRIRVINAGDQVHAMHLHGTAFDVVAQDGNKLVVPQKMDTLTISPGQTFDLLAKETNPGSWLLHCHIFAHSHQSADEHAHGDSGMTGMVTILDVAPADAVLPVSPLSTQPIASTTAALADRDGTGAATTTAWAVLALLVLLATATSLLRTALNRKELP